MKFIPKIVLLLAIFLGTFFTVSTLKKYVFEPSAEIDKREAERRPESYTLNKIPSVELKDVELLARLNQEYAHLIQSVVPSVVSIDTIGTEQARVRNTFGNTQLRNYRTKGVGSGVIVTKEGHIVTNHHVIQNKSGIMVTMSDGKKYDADIIGADQMLDIAILKVREGGDFPALKFGDSEIAQVGQMVFAVGNPFGLGETVTAGHISAKERAISDMQRDLFQTDAAINPGNSGGPLVNLRGEIIGINVAIYSPDKKNQGSHGVGFSIPSNEVEQTLTRILEKGRPIRGYLGIGILDLGFRVREMIGYEGKGGVAVDRVLNDSPAALAGLMSGDIILQFDDVKIQSRYQLIKVIGSSSIGEPLNIKIWRKGKVLPKTARVIEVPKKMEDLVTKTPEDYFEELGSAVKSLGLLVRQPFLSEIAQGKQGLVVENVAPNSTSDEKGLRVNDTILLLNQERMMTPERFYQRVQEFYLKERITLKVARGSRRGTIFIEP